MRYLIPPLYEFYKGLEKQLEGAPDFVLSAIMLLAATVIVWGAFKLPASAKVVIIGWVILP